MKYLLLLHGYTQNATVFQSKIPKQILSLFNVIAPNGPFIIDNDENKRGWWHLSSPDIFTQEHCYENYEKAIEIVLECLTKITKNDTLSIIAFSQGTIVAELVAQKCIVNIDKILLLSPSGIMDSRTRCKIDNMMPILVMIGEKEGIYGICQEHYTKYSSFNNFKVIVHKQGHVFPSQSVDKKIMIEFFAG